MWRLPICLLAMLLCMANSCKRIEAKLERLARAAGISANSPSPAESKPAEAAVTPEQQALETRVLSSALFEATKIEELPKATAFELNKSAVVAILGYHDFRERGGSPMIIAATKFREQMQAIKDSGIPVIPLSDVLAWRKGQKNIPEESIVITMDDGWEGVYTHAYPVLKEFGFPFTAYLYKKYVNIGGRSLSWDQIREMMKNGCEIGSHSVSHESLRLKKGRKEEEHQLWVLGELKDSKEYLEKNLGITCTSFAYPFGIFDESTSEMALQVGYETLVTVNNQKVTWDTPLGKMGRYIIHGETDTNFKLATSFRGHSDIASSRLLVTDAKDEQGKLLVELTPPPEKLITERMPLIQANLKGLNEIIADSVKMRIGGLGIVPAQYDPATMTVSYQLPYKLRREDCAVTVIFKRSAEQQEEAVNWHFKVDLAAAYKPVKAP